MSDRQMTLRELVDAGAHARLAGIFGPGLLARMLDLERDMDALLARELPDADANRRAWWAAQLAHVVATDGTWFGAIVGERPSRQAKALARVHQAACALLQALDDLPAGAVFGTHMRLLGIDLPAPAARQALARELAWRTWGKVDAGLNSRRTAVAELELAAAETREGIRASRGGKHRADRLGRYVAKSFGDLDGPRAVTVSGTGAGPYPQTVKAVLEHAGLRDASWIDVARRAAKDWLEAYVASPICDATSLYGGENDQDRAKISTRSHRKSVHDEEPSRN
jgi:hypothetical protein